MRRNHALILFALLTASTCIVADVSWADDHSEQIAALDEMDRAIAASKDVVNRSSLTLDELRKELYQAAVQTRDAKRLAKDIEEALENGDSIKSELLALEKDILNAGAVLRTVNDQIKQLSAVTAKASEHIADLESEVESVKMALINPSETNSAADSKQVETLQEELAKANDLAEQQGRVIEKLNRKINELKESKGIETDRFFAEDTIAPDIVKAKKLLLEGNIEQAVRLFNKAIYDNPDSDEARLGLAACYFEQGEIGMSRRMTEEVRNRDKSNPNAMGLMGAIYYSEGNLKKARKILEAAVQIDELDVHNLNYLGVVLFELGRQDDGIANVSRAIELDPSYIAAEYNLAVMYALADMPDLTAAGIHYQKALAAGSPRDPLMDELLGLVPDEEVDQ